MTFLAKSGRIPFAQTPSSWQRSEVFGQKELSQLKK